MVGIGLVIPLNNFTNGKRSIEEVDVSELETETNKKLKSSDANNKQVVNLHSTEVVAEDGIKRIFYYSDHSNFNVFEHIAIRPPSIADRIIDGKSVRGVYQTYAAAVAKNSEHRTFGVNRNKFNEYTTQVDLHTNGVLVVLDLLHDKIKVEKTTNVQVEEVHSGIAKKNVGRPPFGSKYDINGKRIIK